MTKTSIGALKREVKALFKGRWLSAVKVTFVPALLTAVGAIIFWLTISLIIFLIRRTGAPVTTSLPQSVSQNASDRISLVWDVIAGLLAILMYTGVKFTFLDWLRTPEEDLERPFKSAFQGFSSPLIGSLLALAILTKLFTYLWGLLLLIPGIIMSYAYRMVYFIYKDHQAAHYGFLELITLSKAMMKGHKWRLFCLDLSFIGWFIVSFIFAGIPLFWVQPYYYATVAAFYKDLAAQQATQDPTTEF